MGRTYADAIAALNTLQSNSSIVDIIRKNGKGMNQQAIPEMIEWCRRLGYEPSEINRLNLIHIAGTKGKGSTSAFISSILVQYTKKSAEYPKPPLTKIGLYTSPHLRFVRERIQINNEPLSEEVFANYFFEVWDRFEASAAARGKPTDTTAKPMYFHFLTLMAFHTYIKEGVDTAIIECGIGGEFDTTNIIVNPTVTGITSLGIDHTVLLGNTIEEIAWHKGGIIKKDAPCYTAPQPPTAISVLKSRATEKSAPLTIVDRNPHLQHIKLGLAADFQLTNASLAIAIAWQHLFLIPYTSPTPLPPKFITGLTSVRWPGRCEIRHEGHISWYIDSGHTLESIELAGSWFASQIPSLTPHTLARKRKRILLFNQQTRDANALAKALHTTLATAIKDEKPFTHVVFCTNITSMEEGYKPDLVSINTSKDEVVSLAVQKSLAETWKGIEGEGTAVVEVKSSIQEAVEWCRDVAKGAMEGGKSVEGESEGREKGEKVMVLVTGSTHLVGGFLEVLAIGDDEGKGVGDGEG